MKHWRKQKSYSEAAEESGVALLLVLLFVVLLTAIVGAFAYEMNVEAALVTNTSSRLEARLAAESAVAMGRSLLRRDLEGLPPLGEGNRSYSSSAAQTTGPEFDALTDGWAAGVPYEEMGDAVVRCTIQDETGKLNLNAMVDLSTGEEDPLLAEALRILFEQRGAEPGVVDAILDWIDPDNEPRPEGAENDYYNGLPVGIGCKNGYMNAVSELLLVRGMTPDLFFGAEDQHPLTELLTVVGASGEGRVNVNTAPAEVLLALGEAMGKPGLADVVLEGREEFPFESEDDLRSRGILDPIDPDAESRPPPSPLTVKGAIFRVRGDAAANDARVRIEAYVLRRAERGDLPVIDWRVWK